MQAGPIVYFIVNFAKAKSPNKKPGEAQTNWKRKEKEKQNKKAPTN